MAIGRRRFDNLLALAGLVLLVACGGGGGGGDGVSTPPVSGQLSVVDGGLLQVSTGGVLCLGKERRGVLLRLAGRT